MRIVIGIKKDDFGDVVLNQLYKYTMMQQHSNNQSCTSRSAAAITESQKAISHFINHRHEIVVRRASYELKKLKSVHIFLKDSEPWII